jgi:flavin-binding protein dodecin
VPLAQPVTLDYPHRTIRLCEHSTLARRQAMASNSVYRVTDLVGTSKVSWEDAVKNAVQTAGKTLRELRVGEVSRLDVTIEKGKVTSFRARVNVSFKYTK